MTPAIAGPVTSNLVLWLDASNGLAADGSTWTDLSGNGHNATALPGKALTLIPNAINGLTAALFSGGPAMSITSTFRGDTGVDPTNIRFADDIGGATDSGAFQQGRGPLSDPAAPFIRSGVSSSTDAAIYQNSYLCSIWTPRSLRAT